MNPIVEKIKKLLRMKRGGTPDEIATALKLAQELADKHGIDLVAHWEICPGCRKAAYWFTP